MNGDEAYEFAWENAPRNRDDSRHYDAMVELVAEQVDFDVAEARRGLARRIIARRMRPGQTAAAGSVVLAGLEHYAYEPHRLIADDEGNVVENRHARAKHKQAEAQRAARARQRAEDRESRERAEADHLTAWTQELAAAGRDPAEAVWDTCVRETGLWKDAEAARESDVDDDAGAAS
ncbi:MAG TPA: hypothetical protein VFM54_14715 [Micromonosporaceae bacterium]|nr:hypothetical protein [Micromonosporaceae bacterium]